MERPKIFLPASRSETILTSLRVDIQTGGWKPGERLNLDDLAALFGVSRMPVRDALKQLEAEGLVRILPHRGIEVSTLDAADIRELFGIRIILEQQAVQLSLPKLGKAQLRRMKTILQCMDRLKGRSDDWIALNAQFHGIINQASGWQKLLSMIQVLRINVERYVRLYIRMLGTEAPQAQHWLLYEACIDGDAAAAKDIVGLHLNATADELILALSDAAADDASTYGDQVGA